MGKYSGISYVILDNGTNAQFANKITTINNCDYNLLDAHRVDWDNSYLYYATSERMSVEHIDPFFEKEDKNGGMILHRYDDATHYPLWFMTGYINHTGELLDITDYLCYITTYAVRAIDDIYDSLNNDKTVLKLDKYQIEKLLGAIDDETGDVRNKPIKFVLKPNQTNSNFYGTDKVYPKDAQVETRTIVFDLKVYSMSGMPLSDPDVFYTDSTHNETYLGSNGKSLMDDVLTTGIDNVNEATRLNANSGNINIGGYFLVTMTLIGWKPGDKFNCKNIDITNRFDSLEGYENENYRRIQYYAYLKQSPKYQRSNDRYVTINISKAENTVDYLYINDEQYVYIPEYFFIKENENPSDPVLHPTFYDYHIKNGYLRSWIIRASMIPDKTQLSKLTREYLYENKLMDFLIPVDNIDEGEDYRKALNIANNSELRFEVYPKYFGNSSYHENYTLPTGYDITDSTKNTIDMSNDNTFETQYNQNISNKQDFIIPLMSLVNGGKLATSINCEINDAKSVNGTNNLICKKCERVIDGVKRLGYTFKFDINIGSTNLDTIIKANTAKASGKTKNSENYTYVDLYFGTTSSTLVGAYFMKIRLSPTNLHKVYLIDYSKKFNDSPSSYEDPEKYIREQITKGVSLVSNNPIDVLKQQNNYMLIDSSFSISNINSQDTEYIWNLSLPILSYLSWNNEKHKEHDVNEAITNLVMPTVLLNKAVKDSDGNRLLDPNDRNELPKEWQNTKFKPNKEKYDHGFPHLYIRGGKSNDNDFENYGLFTTRVYIEDNDQYFSNVTDEIIINYAETYRNNTTFINLMSDKFKSEINVYKTDAEKGEFLCNKFVGINVDDNTLWLTFIRPTIPDREEYWGNSFQNKTEWETEVKNNPSKMFKLMLQVPAKTTTSTGENPHNACNIQVNLNIYRADKSFAGWARRASENNPYIAEEVSLEYATNYVYKSLIGNNEFNVNNNYMLLTRNTGKITLRPEQQIKENGKTINKYTVIFNDGSATNVYCVVKDDSFKFYSSLEEAKTEEVLLNLDSVKYNIDAQLGFKLSFNISGDEWYRGYYDENTRDLDVVVYRKSVNGLAFKSNLGNSIIKSATGVTDESNKFTLPQVLIQNIGGEMINNKSYKAGEYLQLIDNKIYITPHNLKNFLLDPLDFFDVDNSMLLDAYGENWRKDYLKMSITAASTNNGIYATKYRECKDVGLNKNSMSMFLTETKDAVLENTDYGFNRFYNKQSDYSNIENVITFNENKIIDFSKLSISEGETFGLYLALMLPMTNKYRGSLYVIKLDFIVTKI